MCACIAFKLRSNIGGDIWQLEERGCSGRDGSDDILRPSVGVEEWNEVAKRQAGGNERLIEY